MAEYVYNPVQTVQPNQKSCFRTVFLAIGAMWFTETAPASLLCVVA